MGNSSSGITLNNRYRLERKIGDGGFAQVFLATDLALERKVAVKVLAQSWVKDQDQLVRFKNEARAIAALEHPNILLIYDVGATKNGVPYLVMPYISGGTLADRMKQGPFTLDEIGAYLAQIGSALDYAHQRGIIHRDVKPSNLLIRPDGQLVLMDFGLAKLLDTVTDAMVSTGAFGTVAYMAPEQYYGQVSMATDIYMLGVILYQMLAGKLPYEGNTNQVLAGHIQVAPGSLKDVPTLRSLPPHSVLALDQVILKAMAKAPPDRYQTCQTLNYAYYQAIKADPQRVAGNRVFDGGTLVSKKAEPPAPAAGDDAADDATVVRPAAPKKGLRKPARLCVTTEPHKGFSATFDLLGETLTLGRAEDNHLRVPLPIISRHHALLTRITDQREEPTYKITQCKSINSLRFHGNEVSEKILEHGDTIEVGKRGYAEYIVKFTYQAPEYST